MNYDIVLCQSEVDDLFEHPILIEMTQDNLKLTLPQNKLNLQIWLIFALFDYLNFLLKETVSPYDKCWSYIFGELQDIADLICNHRGSFSNSNVTADLKIESVNAKIHLKKDIAKDVQLSIKLRFENSWFEKIDMAITKKV